MDISRLLILNYCMWYQGLFLFVFFFQPVFYKVKLNRSESIPYKGSLKSIIQVHDERNIIAASVKIMRIDIIIRLTCHVSQ